MQPFSLRHFVPLSSILAMMTLAGARAATPLPGTAPLEMQGDITSQLVEGVDRFLLEQIQESLHQRSRFWKRDFASAEKYAASVEPNRKRLAHILGVRDSKLAFLDDDPVAGGAPGAVPSGAVCLGASSGCWLWKVRWNAFGDVAGEGILAAPRQDGRGPNEAYRPAAYIVAIPDADQTPEQLVGLSPGIAPEQQFARRLAEAGCAVLVPTLLDRQYHKIRAGRVTNREWIYRQAFELGRHPVGYEIQKIIAGVDEFIKAGGKRAAKIGVIGWGEGGLLALYAAALDSRIDAACISGYFDSRQDLWQEPLDRNVFGLLEQFGDAEVASLIAPRALIIEAAKGVEFAVPPKLGGGPGCLSSPTLDRVRAEVKRARGLVAGLAPPPRIELIESGRDGQGPHASPAAISALLSALGTSGKSLPPVASQVVRPQPEKKDAMDARQQRTVFELQRYSQQLLAECADVRRDYFRQADTSNLSKFQATVEPYRERFYRDVIGRFDLPLLPPNPRSRQSYDEPKHAGYEVVLDVFPNVIAYGILLVPKDLKPGERRAVVVCQHGLEGRPQDTLRGGHKAYAGFASELADRGFITFSPQNCYIFGDRFRTLQRKANPLGKTLFSIIVPQHQQICDWLATLPFVDPARIAFYGLSYGGKSAMRIPPLVKNYCLSICSGDFDEWIWKNASVGNRYTYTETGEYEIFEFDLGNTFNYAEMAALIAPRPFMVERGHFDGVAPDEAVAFEFAKVRFLYEARLGIGDHCELEWFNGPHMIHLVGTYAFLQKHLGGKP